MHAAPCALPRLHGRGAVYTCDSATEGGAWIGARHSFTCPTTPPSFSADRPPPICLLHGYSNRCRMIGSTISGVQSPSSLAACEYPAGAIADRSIEKSRERRVSGAIRASRAHECCVEALDRISSFTCYVLARRRPSARSPFTLILAPRVIDPQTCESKKKSRAQPAGRLTTIFTQRGDGGARLGGSWRPRIWNTGETAVSQLGSV